MKSYINSIQVEAQRKHKVGWDDQTIYKWLLSKGYTEDTADFTVAKIKRMKNEGTCTKS